jgi:hypothetical protein
MGSEALPDEGVAGHGSAASHAPEQEALRRDPRHGWRRDVTVCVLLGLVSFLIYNANLRSIPAADTYTARYLPFSIWQHRSVVLDPIVSMVAQGRKAPTASRELNHTAFWIRKGRDDHLVSLYPVVMPVVIAPLYLPAIAYLKLQGWDPRQFDEVARIMEKLVASLLAAASVMLLYLLLRRRAEPGTAVLLTLAYAFGTTTWAISSQALWTHGFAQFLIVATLLLITGPCTAFRAAAAGFLCALIACNRQPDAILAAGLGLYALWWAGRRAWLFLAAGALPVGLVLAYNLGVVGHIAGAYALVYAPDFLKHDVLAGVAGLLFSPTRGLFVFSPFLLFVPCFLLSVLRDHRYRGLTAAIGTAAVLQLILYGMGDWRQGISFGPRWQTDLLPILFWMLPPVLAGLSTAGRIAFGLACGVAIAIQAVGAFWYIGVADAAIMADKGPDKMQAAWDIRNAPFIAELRHPPAPADFAVNLRGSIDITAVRDQTGTRAGRQVEVHGWALTNSRSPADVAVTVDGRLAAGTGRFFERIDVVRTLGEPSPSGWQITFAADTLAPGEHVISVLVRAHAGGETRLLAQSRFTLPSEADQELADTARRAAKRLAERQQGSGYWLTAHTDKPRFERPGQEMNTFLNAMMIDVVGPVAQPAGVDGPLTRARAFLTKQIEAGGLVRYHGRPDAPTIGTLGCAITPDADDTALVWRIAPGGRREALQTALETLKQFRTDDGLYRTWLAPRERYQCIDPGKDPNPTDIAIQIHVLMLLAQADPPASRALCEALRQRLDDDALWVYYKMAPPLLILRRPDLRKAGCPLPLPAPRLQTTVPGQEIWIAAAELLRRVETVEGRDAAYAETTALLRKLAADEFSLLALAPPLLYHNDLSASVRRFYWSEELGYALWLRLYFENERVEKR